MLSSQLDTIAYQVQPGDNLTRIIHRYYGAISPQQRQSIIAQIQRDNTLVRNPATLYPINY